MTERPIFEPPLDVYLNGDAAQPLRVRAAQRPRTNDEPLRRIPNRLIVLKLLCNEDGRRRLFGVVIQEAAGDTLMLGKPPGWPLPDPPSRPRLTFDEEEGHPLTGHLCGCGRLHMFDLAAVWRHADTLRGQDSKRRVMDIKACR